ncbi:MAG: polyhydroxyalkanoate synthesis regulator DNA-binding domain-containing protein [Myxococcota bacterium]
MVWKRPSRPLVVKKYSNRRLYDTEASRYITLVELAELVEGGTDVRVVDAKSGQDLTQVTLMQIILDGRGAAELLPIELLTQLIRMGDDALAEFLGRYMSYALELYVQMKQGAEALAPYNPFASVPLAAVNTVAKLWSPSGSASSEIAPEQQVSVSSPDEDGDKSGEIEALRAELESLRESINELNHEASRDAAVSAQSESSPEASREPQTAKLRR